MNRDKRYYYPLLLYILLLLLVWLASWVVGVVGLLSGNDFELHNLLSATGIRWTLRNAVGFVDSAPWATAIFGVLCIGLLRGSGFIHSFSLMISGCSLSHNRSRALWMSISLLLCLILLLFIFSISADGILMSVTNTITSSPLYIGWILLLLLIIILVSAMHGAVYGSYRNIYDMLDGVVDVFSIYIPAYMAMLPASGLLPTVAYVGIDVPYHAIIESMLYASPFIYVTVCLLCNKSNSK